MQPNRILSDSLIHTPPLPLLVQDQVPTGNREDLSLDSSKKASSFFGRSVVCVVCVVWGGAGVSTALFFVRVLATVALSGNSNKVKLPFAAALCAFAG